MTGRWVVSRSTVNRTLSAYEHKLFSPKHTDSAAATARVWLSADNARIRRHVVSYPQGVSYNSFSTSAKASSTASDREEEEDGAGATMPKKKTSFTTSLRNMVKPFFMRCHPDVQSSASAKEVNLTAIQNLNAFLDSVSARLKPGARATRNEKTVFEVDFCITFEERVKGKKQDILCRRKVELSLPKQQVTTTNPAKSKEKLQEIQIHVENQLVKLLHIAGLKAPTSTVYQEKNSVEEEIERSWGQALEDGDFDRLSPAQIRFARNQKYNRNRDAFTSRINWKRYDEVYKETVKDIRANWAVEGLIRNDPQRRMAYIAEILSRVRIEEVKEENGEEIGKEVDPVMQLIALRRLSLLMDEYFDELRLEDLGKMWDSTVMVLTPARSFNTSTSALYKQRKRQTKGDVMANDGFAFTLHHDNSVTIHIPVDFRDDELLSQLTRHVKDYYSLIDLGLEGIFPRATTSSDKD